MSKKSRRRKRWWRSNRRQVLLAALLTVLVVGGAGAAWAAFNENVDETLTKARSHQLAPTTTTAPNDDVRLGGGADLAAIRRQLASDQPLAISVLGDSTGNGEDEWVRLWAEHLAGSRAVTYNIWDDGTRSYSGIPDVLSTEGPETVIWNASAAGRTASYPASQIRGMQPERPDLVVLNFGHNNTASNLDSELYSTLAAIERRWGTAAPTVAILQNPDLGESADQQEATVRALRTVIAPAFGLPTIDVWSAFEESHKPLSALVSSADGLGIHPTAEGSAVWVRTVRSALD